MAATMLRVRVWIRRRVAQLLVTALLIGLIAGLVMGLAAGTRRTASAPDRYTAAVGGDPDLVILQLSGAPLTARIADVAGVAEARSVAFVTSFLIAPDDGSPVFEPNPFAGDDRFVGARVVEGRFADPGTPDEFTVNRVFAALLAERFGTRVGDQFQVTSFDQQQVAANAFETLEGPAVPLFTATLVGITETPSDFDEASASMTFSEAFLGAHPTVGVAQTIIAVQLDPGTDPDAVLAAVHDLPSGGDAYAVPFRIVSADSRRAVQFQVTSLWLVTAIAVLAVTVVIWQMIGRMLRMDDDERSSLLAVGWRSRDIAVERAIEGGVAALIAVPVAAIIGSALTGLFPLGVLRSFEPDPGVTFDAVVVLCGVIATSAIVVAGATSTGHRHLTRPASKEHGEALAGLISTGGAGMALTTAARMTTSGSKGRRRSLTSFAVGAIGVAGVVASGIVGLTLTNIVDEPARWGVNYDQLFGNPYVAAQDDIVAPILEDPDAVAVTAAHIGSLTINGRDVATFVVDAVKGGLLPVTIDGRPPANVDEIGLGAEVARGLGVGVGDDVEVAGSTGVTTVVQVVGIVVTPDSAGNGASMTFAGYVALSPTATRNVVLVRFREGTPGGASETAQTAEFSPPDALETPTSVRALERVTAAPFVLGIVLTILMIVACAYLLEASGRARRRDLAVLRALGSDSGQLRAIIHWQAMLVTAFTLVVGLPLGIILGRSIVDRVTDALGIVPGADVPVMLVMAVVLAAIAAANLLAVLPARRASRANVAELMRDR
ncbi:MAG: ABC transporter permease [Ilumatobacteraceae bacterium]